MRNSAFFCETDRSSRRSASSDCNASAVRCAEIDDDDDDNDDDDDDDNDDDDNDDEVEEEEVFPSVLFL